MLNRLPLAAFGTLLMTSDLSCEGETKENPATPADPCLQATINAEQAAIQAALSPQNPDLAQLAAIAEASQAYACEERAHGAHH